MAEAPTVRPVAASDRAGWEPLWEGYNLFYERLLQAEITDVLWRRMFDPAEPVFGAVAERDGRTIGLVHYLFHRSTTVIEPVCYLQDLFTDPAARCSGAGRALILFVYDRAREAGCSRVYWQTHETNRTAMALYEKVATRSPFVRYVKDVAHD